MRLEPLYRIRLPIPRAGLSISMEAGSRCSLSRRAAVRVGWLGVPRCELSRKEGAAGPFRPDFRAVIEADDGAVVMMELHGYGRAYPPGRRQIVGTVFHHARSAIRFVGDTNVDHGFRYFEVDTYDD
jgi:hypothetical protein